jgi:hypothetical protein
MASPRRAGVRLAGVLACEGRDQGTLRCGNGKAGDCASGDR